MTTSGGRPRSHGSDSRTSASTSPLTTTAASSPAATGGDALTRRRGQPTSSDGRRRATTTIDGAGGGGDTASLVRRSGRFFRQLLRREPAPLRSPTRTPPTGLTREPTPSPAWRPSPSTASRYTAAEMITEAARQANSAPIDVAASGNSVAEKERGGNRDLDAVGSRMRTAGDSHSYRFTRRQRALTPVTRVWRSSATRSIVSRSGRRSTSLDARRRSRSMSRANDATSRTAEGVERIDISVSPTSPSAPDRLRDVRRQSGWTETSGHRSDQNGRRRRT